MNKLKKIESFLLENNYIKIDNVFSRIINDDIIIVITISSKIFNANIIKGNISITIGEISTNYMFNYLINIENRLIEMLYNCSLINIEYEFLN